MSVPQGIFPSKGALLVIYWTCKYKPNRAMSNFPIDLKVAIMDVDWLYQDK